MTEIKWGRTFPRMQYQAICICKSNTKRLGLIYLHCQVHCINIFPKEIQKFISFLNSRKKTEFRIDISVYLLNISHSISILKGIKCSLAQHLPRSFATMSAAFCYTLDYMVFKFICWTRMTLYAQWAYQCLPRYDRFIALIIHLLLLKPYMKVSMGDFFLDINICLNFFLFNNFDINFGQLNYNFYVLKHL